MIVNHLLMKVTLFFSSWQTVDDFFAVNDVAQEKCWKQEKKGDFRRLSIHKKEAWSPDIS